MFTIDLNSDLGESFGAYTLGQDEEILEIVTSANIACGFHAGDPSTMRKTVEIALKKGTAIGAHPSLPDLQGFGRRHMAITPEEAYDLVIYQVGALMAFVRAEGGTVQHVKPHGAFYHMANHDAALAEAIAKAVYRIDPDLILFGQSGSQLIMAGEKIGLRVANEVFADRTYQEDGSLTPRSSLNAVIHDLEQAVQQVTRIIKKGEVEALSGKVIKVKADTICIHGDGPQALDIAKRLRDRLLEEQIHLKAVGKS